MNNPEPMYIVEGDMAFIYDTNCKIWKSFSQCNRYELDNGYTIKSCNIDKICPDGEGPPKCIKCASDNVLEPKQYDETGKVERCWPGDDGMTFGPDPMPKKSMGKGAFLVLQSFLLYMMLVQYML